MLKTLAVADLLGIPYYRLVYLLKARRLVAPAKDSSGDFCWTADDVERARAALAALRPYPRCREEAVTE